MSKRKEQALQDVLNTPETWNEAMDSGKLYVVDAHQTWSGPCTAVTGLFKTLKNELGDDLLKFATANVDLLDELQAYRGKCKPRFLFYGSGHLVGEVHGCNAPLLIQTIRNALSEEHKILDGEKERNVTEGEGVKSVSPAPLLDAAPTEKEDEVEKETCVTRQVTIAVIKPDVVSNGQVGEILKKISEAGIEILQDKEMLLTEQEARDFYKSKSEESFFENLVSYITSGPCRVLVLTKGDAGEGVVELWRDIIGPFDAAVAKEDNPNSLRALYGTDATSNALHGSSSSDDAMRELAFFFPDYERPVSRQGPEIRISAIAEDKLQRTLALIRPDALKRHKDEILKSISEAGFSIAMQKEVLLSKIQVEKFYSEHKDKPFFPQLVNQMTCGPVLALCLANNNAISQWRGMLGPKRVSDAIEKAPESLRARFTVDNQEINMLHGSDDPEAAEKEIKQLFDVEETIAVIKPDAQEQREGIIEKLRDAGFMISCQKDMNLSPEIAAKLYESKEGTEFYDDLIGHMTSGPTLMMVLSAENAVQKLREVCGPTNPEEAKEKAPDSIRAHFATSLLANAIHSPSSPDKVKQAYNVMFGDTEYDLRHSTLQTEIAPILEVGEPTENTADENPAKVEASESTADSNPAEVAEPSENTADENLAVVAEPSGNTSDENPADETPLPPSAETEASQPEKSDGNGPKE